MRDLSPTPALDDDIATKKYVDDLAGGGGSIYTKPVLADFPTAYNITGNCQVADTVEGMAIAVSQSGFTSNRGLIKPAPATPYSVVWKQNYSFTNPLADDVIGVLIRDSATDRLITWGPNSPSNLCLQKWNSATSYNTVFLQSGNVADVNSMCFRFVDDGTDHLFQIGATIEGPWITWFSQSRTAWLANPDEIGICIEEQSGHGHYFQCVQHWEEAA